MRVLAFDQAKHCGWAAWDGSADFPTLGVKELKYWGVEDGAMLERFRAWLGRMFEDHQPEAVAVEDAAPGPNNDLTTIYRQAGVVAMIAWACHIKQIPLYRIPPASWRKTFIGFGTRGKRVDVNWKQLSLDRCRVLGWNTLGNHNAAEAGAILDHVLMNHLKVLTPWRRRDDLFLPLPEIEHAN